MLVIAAVPVQLPLLSAEAAADLNVYGLSWCEHLLLPPEAKSCC